jgi:hypothetical protein
VWGSSINAAGVVGISSHNTGVGGLANRDDGVGVQGVAPVTGTVGIAINSNGLTYGIYGKSDSDSGIGVYGESGHIGVEGDGETGVRGWSDDGGGVGVYGRSSAGSGTGIGVYGRSDSPDGKALYGLATGGGYGLYSEGDAHVDGDLEINGDLTWDERTGYIAISPAAFHPVHEWYTYSNWGNKLTPGDNTSPYYYANVQLPHGATITKLECTWLDASSNNASCSLYRNDLSGGGAPMATTGSAGINGKGNSSTKSISNAIVDNARYTYSVELHLPDNNTTAYSVLIEYTFAEPY